MKQHRGLFLLCSGQGQQTSPLYTYTPTHALRIEGGQQALSCQNKNNTALFALVRGVQCVQADASLGLDMQAKF